MPPSDRPVLRLNIRHAYRVDELEHGVITSLRLRVAQQALEGCSDDLLVVECERLREHCHIVPLRLCRIILPATKQPQRGRAHGLSALLEAPQLFAQSPATGGRNAVCDACAAVTASHKKFEGCLPSNNNLC